MSETPYKELARIADSIFAICEDDDACISEQLTRLETDIRDEILTSDLLNSYQTFYYYFREYPGDMAEEMLLFQPAGKLKSGIKIGELGTYELSFQVTNNIPIINVTNEEEYTISFSGKTAFREALEYCEQ